MADGTRKEDVRQLRNQARERWDRLTDGDLDQIQGRRDILVGKLQERYGYSRQNVEEQVSDWLEEIRTN